MDESANPSEEGGHRIRQPEVLLARNRRYGAERSKELNSEPFCPVS